VSNIVTKLEALAPELYERQRAEAILEARDAGVTWRTIADALGMTQAGVQRIARRARGE
jgi:transcriptional regulator